MKREWKETGLREIRLAIEAIRALAKSIHARVPPESQSEDDAREIVSIADRALKLAALSPADALREALKVVRDYIRDVGHAQDCDVIETYGEMGCSCGYREKVFSQIDAALREARPAPADALRESLENIEHKGGPG